MREVSSDKLSQIVESYGVKTSFIYMYVFSSSISSFSEIPAINFQPDRKSEMSGVSLSKETALNVSPRVETQVSCSIDGDRQDSVRDILQTSAKGLYHDIAQCPSAASGQRCITIRNTARDTASSHTG